jgi:hypothetical protein
MKGKALFDSINSIEELEKFLLSDSIFTEINKSFFNCENLDEVFASLKNIDKEKEKKLLSYLKCLDKNLRNTSARSTNARQKIPTLLAGIIYITKYYNETLDYCLDDIMILSHYSAMEDMDFYLESTNILPKKILDLFKTKSPGFIIYDEYIEIVRDLYDEGYSEEEIITYLNSKSSKELLDIYKNKMEEIADKGGFVI